MTAAAGLNNKLQYFYIFHLTYTSYCSKLHHTTNHNKPIQAMKHLSYYIDQLKGENFIEKHGAFYAFSAEQFKQQAQKGRQYVQIGAGLICPKDTAAALVEEFNEIHRRAMAQDLRENGAEGIVEREYFNYECQISIDLTDFNDALAPYKEAFPKLFPDAMISRVANACYEKAVRNDWF